jgi:hypothetical protein
VPILGLEMEGTTSYTIPAEPISRMEKGPGGRYEA